MAMTPEEMEVLREQQRIEAETRQQIIDGMQIGILPPGTKLKSEKKAKPKKK